MASGTSYVVPRQSQVPLVFRILWLIEQKAELILQKGSNNQLAHQTIAR
jgi:hypothetical protein